MRLLITGATGFIGTAVCDAAQAVGATVVRALRRPSGSGVGDVVVGDIGMATEWKAALLGVDCVIHLAARVHVMRETASDPLDAFRQVNVIGAQRLAQQAADAGVRRLVFVSSIKVNGERTADRPFTETDAPAPEDAYGRSKLEAELALRRISAETGLEVVIVRPPLVVGEGAGGNLRRLLETVRRGIPLPFGLVHNRRSLILREHLAGMLLAAANVPQAAGEVLLAADEPPISTGTLVRWIAAGMGRRARMIPVPPPILHAAARLSGNGPAMERLLGSLVIDGSKARRMLGWTPPGSLEAGVARTAAEFLKGASPR